MEAETQGNLESTELIKPPKIIKENSAEILEPPGRKVFYNPVQEFNRDLSVLVLQSHSKLFQNGNNNSANGDSDTKKSYKILEALSATGLRSIRYAKEIPNVTQIIANDYSYDAIKSIEVNIKHNNVESVVTPSQLDASVIMFNNINPAKRFEVIDLDPYGSPVRFLDPAVQCVADGGMLLVTSTDTGVLCGVYPETCFAKYGSLSLKTSGKHEMAIRILLQCIQCLAAKYKRYIEPVLSISADFYIRVFVKVHTSAAVCKKIFSKYSVVYLCCGCDAKVLQPMGNIKENENGKKIQYLLPHIPEIGGKCKHCGGNIQMGGPIWNGPIHDPKFIDHMIESNEIKNFGTSKRLLGMLSLIKEELHDIPLYYSVASMCKTLKCTQMPSLILSSAILNAGYRVSKSHASKDSLKTDAPMSFLWDVFRAWVKQKPVKEKSIIPGSPGEKILNRPIQNEINFSQRPDANPASRKLGLLRYQINPAPNWGPGVKSTTLSLEEPTRLKKKRKTEG